MQISGEEFSKRMFGGLLLVEVLLVLLDGFVSYGGGLESRALRRLFNITREDSIPNWFSSMQFLLIALVVWAIFWRVREQYSPKWRVVGWGLLSGLFLFLSMDDGSKFHERIGTFVSENFRGTDSLVSAALNAHPSYSWHVALGPIFAVVGICVLGFVWRELELKQLRRFFLFAVLSLIASQVMDFLEGIDSAVHSMQSVFSASEYTVRHFAKSCEEFIEMFAQSVLLVVFIRHLSSLGCQVIVKD